MKIETWTHELPRRPELLRHVEARLGTALGRFADRVGRVAVRIRDLNGPRGGQDIRVSIRAELAGAGTLQVEEVALNPYAAVSGAADRAGRRVARAVQRERRRRRRG